MKLRYVTFTGVDDETSIDEMQAISKEHPFIEWGVLLSKSAQGKKARFPSRETLDKLANAYGLRLSGHLCGSWVQDLLTTGHFDHEALGPIWDKFKRVQVNSVGRERHYSEAFTNCPYFLNPILKRQCILQVGREPLGHVLTIKAPDLLFDRSGGKGQVPGEWPEHDREFFCGYAGGLSPDNIIEQLMLISEKVGHHEIWIDLETGVRTDDRFDLQKVKAVIEKVLPLTQNVQFR